MNDLDKAFYNFLVVMTVLLIIMSGILGYVELKKVDIMEEECPHKVYEL